jgi:hypothetical protein
MKNVSIKFLTICAILFLASCATPKTQTITGEIQIEVSEEFLEQLNQFGETMKKVIGPIANDDRFSDVSVTVESESNSIGNQMISNFVMELYYDKAQETDDEILRSIAKATLQKAISNLEDPSYKGYELKFLKDASTNEESSEVFKSYKFAVEELIEV